MTGIDRQDGDLSELEPLEPLETCGICGRELWADGLPPALDGSAWICGDCDAARNFTALDF